MGERHNSHSFETQSLKKMSEKQGESVRRVVHKFVCVPVCGCGCAQCDHVVCGCVGVGVGMGECAGVSMWCVCGGWVWVCGCVRMVGVVCAGVGMGGWIHK